MRAVIKTLIVSAAMAGGMAIVSQSAVAQISHSAFRASNGYIYQVIQHPAFADGGVGGDAVRVTTIAASAVGVVNTCVWVGDVVNPSEAWAYANPAFVVSDLNTIRKSVVIDDATSPTFDSAGDGSVCIGPGCQLDGTCIGGAGVCTTFTRNSGVPFINATTIPGAVLNPAVTSSGACAAGAQASYAFGTGGNPTVVAAQCSSTPFDGFSLADASSTFTGGLDGQTLIVVYDNAPLDPMNVAVGGFLVDTDGSSIICPAMSNVVLLGTTHQISIPAPAVTPTPTATSTSTPTSTNTATPTPVPPSKELKKCQSMIAKASRVYANKVLKTIQKCRDSVLAGKIEIDPATCPTADVKTAEKIEKAGLKVRDKIADKCTDDLIGELDACAATVDGLVSASGDDGCIIMTHMAAVLDMIEAEYGN